jgi:hypothetical protein
MVLPHRPTRVPVVSSVFEQLGSCLSRKSLVPNFDGTSGGLAEVKMLKLASIGRDLGTLACDEDGLRVGNARPAQSGSAVSAQKGCLRQPAQAAWRLLYAALDDSCSRAIRSLSAF